MRNTDPFCKFTLEDEKAGRIGFISPKVSVEPMTTDALFSMSDKDRIDWYKTKISHYDNQLSESSIKNKIPKKLIAAIILNELADINVKDQAQERFNLSDGSFGPAQMQTYDTAMKFGHVDTIKKQLDSLKKRTIKSWGLFSISEKSIIAFHISQRLRIMQVAIEAAAREINRLLNLMRSNILKPWQREHQLNPPPTPKTTTLKSIQGMYYGKGQISGDTEAERFMYLCQATAAAYNSPDIIITNRKFESEVNRIKHKKEQEWSQEQAGLLKYFAEPYKNARNHGGNGATIGLDIAEFNLFR
ncbi:hypothetical protein [Corallococcus sp. CA047B]|uniref:hypothetical protein n=1 Tax=Corallococcus sp. CA047B TaxID=2316729 RepID=UPI0011C3D38D|nr:hypothetical protein [Corallococcus sp. CA047B]